MNKLKKELEKILDPLNELKQTKELYQKLIPCKAFGEEKLEELKVDIFWSQLEGGVYSLARGGVVGGIIGAIGGYDVLKLYMDISNVQDPHFVGGTFTGMIGAVTGITLYGIAATYQKLKYSN